MAGVRPAGPAGRCLPRPESLTVSWSSPLHAQACATTAAPATSLPEKHRDMLMAKHMPKRPLLWGLVLAGLGVGPACAQNGAAAIVIDYPANDSIFPPDMAAPTFLWRDPAPGAVSWRIDVSFADGSPAIHVAAKGERMRVGEIDPRCISSTN